MPRQPRRDAPGALQHVMVRGIEKRAIFRDDVDRRDFVARLERLLPEEDFDCLAWVLMTNHVHLLLKTGNTPLSRLMARLGTGYAAGFNRRHGRAGHLFQNRFHSVLVESDAHLEILVCYVHLNPLRSGLVRRVAELERYPWSGYPALMGRSPCGFLSAEILGWFGADPATARRNLRILMESQARDPEQGPQSPDPPSATPPTTRRSTNTPPALWRPSRASKEPVSVDPLLAWVCQRVGAEHSAVLSGRKTAAAVRARSITAYLAAARLQLKGVDISRALNLDAGSTSRAVTRGRRFLRDLPPDPDSSPAGMP